MVTVALDVPSLDPQSPPEQKGPAGSISCGPRGGPSVISVGSTLSFVGTAPSPHHPVVSRAEPLRVKGQPLPIGRDRDKPDREQRQLAPVWVERSGV
jgi:hypothetical protein